MEYTTPSELGTLLPAPAVATDAISRHPSDAANHVRALDGIRGIAILQVMLAHFTFLGRPADGGTAVKIFSTVFSFMGNGVDLFFVLSGFLITGILLKAKSKPRYFSIFYARRTLRIFPLYYAVLIGVFGTLGIMMLLDMKLSAISMSAWHQQIWLWTYTTNYSTAFYNHLHSPTWATLVHFWSLACEEQFYLVWPAVVLLCRPKALMSLCGAALLVMPVLRYMLLAHGCDRYYYVATIDGLFLGSFLATLVSIKSPWISRLKEIRLAFAVFFAIGIAVILLDRASKFAPSLDAFARPIIPLMPTPLVLAFGFLILHVTGSHPSALARRICESRVLVFFGKYSYGIYVFHFLLVNLFLTVILERGLRRISSGIWTWPAFVVLASLASIAIALISWNLLEKQCLRLKRYFEYRERESA